MPTALLVDDDVNSCRAMGGWIQRHGFVATSAHSLEQTRQALGERAFDLVLLDLELPDGSGLELLPLLESTTTTTEVVFLTGHATVDSAVEAFRGGAADYLTKPVDLNRLRKIVGGVARTLDLRDEVSQLRQELRRLGRFGPMLGASAPMQAVYDLIERGAPTDATIFVTGETGTGKELVAQTVHRLSARARMPFVPVNCGAMPPHLVESELFGHERGSFTGAERRHRGVFERASGGTLFLDEITEMPVELQVKLLRVLETGQVERIGGDRPIGVDVRVVAATNRDAKRAVERGRLRQDLLYRLLVFPIELPPLRERPGDVDLLVDAFVDRLSRESGQHKHVTVAARTRLREQAWPGNVRELANVVERAFIRASDRIDVESLGLDPHRHGESDASGDTLRVAVGSSVADTERRLLLATLERFEGDKRKTAQVLGISLKTVYNRLNAYRGERRAGASED